MIDSTGRDPRQPQHFKAMKLFTAFAALAFVAAPVQASISSESDLMGGKAKHLYVIESTTTVNDSIGRDKTVGLGIRCNYNNKGLEAVILTPTYNGRNNRVSTRWNQERPSNGRWSRATSGKGFFHSSPKSFLSELLSNNTLAFAWTPYNRAQVAAKWDLTSAKSDLKTIKSLCGA